MGDFGEDTRVEGTDGSYRATLSEDWNIWGPNGGYVAAIALRAAGAATTLPRPASFAGHFLSVAKFAEVQIDVVPLRAARRAASLRVSIRQGEQAVFDAIVWAADHVDGLDHIDVAMPEVPDPDTLPPIEELRGEVSQNYAFWDNIEERPIGPWVPWEERKAGPPVFREWMRFRPRATFEGDAFLDAARSLLLKCSAPRRSTIWSLGSRR